MKVYQFEQSNNFGDTLSMIINAENEQDAKDQVKKFIIEKTNSPEKAYSEEVEYVKNSFEKVIRRVQDYIINYPEQVNHKKLSYAEKILCTSGTCYSIDDYLADPEGLCKIFAEEDSKRTYLWFFENEEYLLEELCPTERGIVSYDFIYCGR